MHCSTYRSGRACNSETVRYKDTLIGTVKYKCYTNSETDKQLYIADIDKMNMHH